MKPIPFIDLSYQSNLIRGGVQKKWNKIIENSSFVMGSYLEEFEDSFSKFSGIKNTIGVGNGGDAIEIGIRTLNLPKNSKIYIPVNTFIATATAARRAGYEVQFVDVNEQSGLIDLNTLSSYKILTKDCVIPVHLFGFMVDVKAIKKSLNNNIKIIEDSSQAHGATYDGSPPGSFSNLSTYSFYPGKNLGAFGDGGAITTNNLSTYNKAILLRNYGISKKYNHDIIGFNSRLDPIQAVVLTEKLKFLQEWNLERKNNFELYFSSLKDVEQIEFLKSPNLSDSVYHLTVAKVTNRTELIKFLNKDDISTIIHYPIPLHKSKAFKNYKYKKGEFKNAELLSKKILSLPNYPGLKNNQIEYICEKIRAFYKC